jgi:hypothetical protein
MLFETGWKGVQGLCALPSQRKMVEMNLGFCAYRHQVAKALQPGHGHLCVEDMVPNKWPLTSNSLLQ